MTATPPDPLATQHDGTPDPDDQGPVDTQTSRLREENRALRELLAAQVHAALPEERPGWFRRLCWALISAPGAALVGWRSLVGREEGAPITRRRLGYATLTVLYTLAIYGALVLLVVSWNSPNGARSGATAASPVRVPLGPPAPMPPDADPADKSAAPLPQTSASASPESSPTGPVQPATGAAADPAAPSPAASAPVPAASKPTPAAAAPSSTNGPAVASAAPQSTLRVTEIPAPNPLAWVDALQGELARCAELGFFERPDCAWAARKQFCEPNHGWGTVKDCPAQP